VLEGSKRILPEMTDSSKTPVTSKVAIIAMTAVLYTVAKAATGYVPTPWGVGQLLIGIFVPAFFAVVCDTWSVAIGAGLGTFIGDSLFLTPAGSTNPALSLIAGVPANFVAFLLFGWFVKRYRSWNGFVAATVSFVTLGNLIAATSIVLFGASVFTALKPLVASYYSVALIFGFTFFWTVTMVPIIIVVVPFLVRAVKPLKGRSTIISNIPAWSETGVRTSVLVSTAISLVLIGLAILYLPGVVGLSGYPRLTDDIALGIVGLVIVVPAASVMISSARKS
jgi:hypothetical protein